MSAHPLLYFQMEYQLMPLILISGLVAIVGMGLRSLCGTIVRISTCITIALVGTGLMLAGLPATTEGLYWLPGSVSYFFGIQLVVFLFLGIGRWLTSQGGRIGSPWYLSCLLGTFVIAGLSEVCALVMIVMLVALFLYSCIWQRKATLGAS